MKKVGIDKIFKPTEEILELIRPTVEVVSIINTKLNIKDNGE